MGWLLFLTFFVLPAYDLYMLFTADFPFRWPMAVLLLAVAVILGLGVIARAGGRLLRDVAQSLSIGHVPTNDMLDGALRMTAGVLLIAPGFLTDAVALLILFPPVRVALRFLLRSHFARHLRVHTFGRADSTEDPEAVFGPDDYHPTHKPDIVVPPGAARPEAGNDPRLPTP